MIFKELKICTKSKEKVFTGLSQINEGLNTNSVINKENIKKDNTLDSLELVIRITTFILATNYRTFHN